MEYAMARKKSRCFQILMDFANLFKAFIGVNYLSIAFAISQSGIVLGIIGLLLISSATVHCCHLIIKCKRELIRQIIEDKISNEHQHPETLTKTRLLLNTTLEKRLSYGDIASMSLGKIVPIESSMEDNHHLFPHLLYLVMLLFTCVLASLGFLSYLRLGTSTAQVIIWNLQPNSMLQLIVSLVVCIGVVFTFPLQCFPIIEIFEHLLFAPGKFCGPLKKKSSISNHGEDEQDTVHDSDLRVDVHTAITGSKEDEELCYLLQDSEAANCLTSVPGATEIPKSVWSVKRNILRTLIVVAQLGTAYAFKDEFAYISSFTGAIGSTMIAYIIPAVIHLKLKRHDLGMMIICKDIFLIIFGLIGGVTGVYTSVRSIIADFQ